MQDRREQVDLEAAYQEYADLVYRFLYVRTRDREWSQELMQETFLRAVGSISRYDGSCKLSVWLCQIAKHILYQELRKKKRLETTELDGQIIFDASARDGEAILLDQCATKRNVMQGSRYFDLIRDV